MVSWTPNQRVVLLCLFVVALPLVSYFLSTTGLQTQPHSNPPSIPAPNMPTQSETPTQRQPQPVPIATEVTSAPPPGTTTHAFPAILPLCAVIAQAWYSLHALSFGQPATLPPVANLSLPRFAFINAPPSVDVAEKCSGMHVHEAIECSALNALLPRIAHLGNDSNLLVVVTMNFHVWFHFDKPGKKFEEYDRTVNYLKRLPVMEHRYYFISCKFWTPELQQRVHDLHRRDLIFSDYDFSRYTEPFVHGVTFPYIDVLPDNYTDAPRPITVYFRGTCHHRVRILLSELFVDIYDKDVIVEWKPNVGYDGHDDRCNKTRTIPGYNSSTAGKHTYIPMMQQSRFCLCPSGDQAWTMRLVDILSVGCIPIFLANDITLPFEEVIPWSKFSLFFPVELLAQPNQTAAIFLDYLRAFKEEELRPIRELIHSVFLEYFATPQGRAISTMHSAAYHWKMQTFRPSRFTMSYKMITEIPRWDGGWN